MTGPVGGAAPDSGTEPTRFRVAWECLDVADALSAQAFRNRAYTVSYKADGSPMVDMEVAIEREMGRRIRAAFPSDGMLGEELGGSAEADSLWVVDPVDGTANFIEGVPIYAHMICYVRSGRPLFAAVSAPLLGRRWWAAAGQGAFEGGRRLSVSDVSRLAEARIGYGGLRDYGLRTEGFVRLIRACRRARGFGNFLPHMLVAEGTYELASSGDGGEPWDVMALELIVTEAGGRLTSMDGHPNRAGEAVLTSNGLLHAPALRVVNEGSRSRAPGAAAETPSRLPRHALRTVPPGTGPGSDCSSPAAGGLVP